MKRFALSLLVLALGNACTTRTFVTTLPPGEPGVEEETSGTDPTDGEGGEPSDAGAHDAKARDAKADAKGCTPTTCAAEGKTCGSIPDGCGATLDCGKCPSECAGKADDSPCGYHLNEFCESGECVSLSTYCVDDDPDDYWNHESFRKAGYSPETVKFCTCDGSTLSAALLTGSTVTASCNHCASILRYSGSLGYVITACF